MRQQAGTIRGVKAAGHSRAARKREPGGGRVVLVETKARDGVLEPSQIAVHAALRERGYPVVVWRSLDDVARLIESVGR